MVDLIGGLQCCVLVPKEMEIKGCHMNLRVAPLEHARSSVHWFIEEFLPQTDQWLKKKPGGEKQVRVRPRVPMIRKQVKAKHWAKWHKTIKKSYLTVKPSVLGSGRLSFTGRI